MRVAKLVNKSFQIDEVEDIHLKPNQTGAIVKVNACGLCGSDIVKIMTGTAPNGAVLGHEVVGEIVEINTKTSFCKGDRVVLGHHVPCFDCEYCYGESYSMCKQFKETNIYPGGFSEYIYVSELHLENTVFEANYEIPDEHAIFTEPVACCLRAVKRLKLTQGSKVLVIGLGSIGLLTGQLLKYAGYKPFGVDMIDERIQLAEDYGFEGVFKASDNNLNEKVEKCTKYGFDGIFLCAGSDSSVELAKSLVRNGGTILVFASSKTNVGYLHNDIYYKELTVLGSYSPSPLDLEESYSLIEKDHIRVDELVSDYPLEKINQALEDTLSNKIMKACIKL